MDTKMITNQSDWQNRESFRQHKKQQGWQILFPVGLGIGIILILAVLIVLAAGGGDGALKTSGWADASLIWLILPILVFAIVITVILLALIFLLAQVMKIIPSYTTLLQNYGLIISKKAKLGSDKLVAPFIAIKCVNARVVAFFAGLFGRSTQ